MRKIMLFGKPLSLLLLLTIWNAIGCIAVALGVGSITSGTVEELVQLTRNGADVWGILPHMALLPGLCGMVVLFVFANIANFNWNIYQGLKLSRQQIRSWVIVSAIIHGMAALLAIAVLVVQNVGA